MNRDDVTYYLALLGIAFAIVFVTRWATYLEVVDHYESRSYSCEDVNFTEDLVNGYYHPNVQTIEVFGRGRDWQQVENTAQHEVAHYMWYEYLYEDERRLYEQIYNDTDVYVTEYAQENHKEDFAETWEEARYCYIDWEMIPEDRLGFFMELLDNE